MFMYMYMCICIYIYIYIHIRVYTYIYIYIYICMYIYICIYILMNIYGFQVSIVLTQISPRKNCLYAHLYTYRCICMRIHIYVFIHECIYRQIYHLSIVLFQKSPTKKRVCLVCAVRKQKVCVYTQSKVSCKHICIYAFLENRVVSCLRRAERLVILTKGGSGVCLIFKMQNL